MRTEPNVEIRPANWLPLPGDELGGAEPVPVVDEDDLFPKGTVTAFYPRQGYGYVKTAKGESLIFRLPEIDLLGPKGHPRHLAAGSRVGYDVSWTSHGVHISRIKVY